MSNLLTSIIDFQQQDVALLEKNASRTWYKKATGRQGVATRKSLSDREAFLFCRGSFKGTYRILFLLFLLLAYIYEFGEIFMRQTPLLVLSVLSLCVFKTAKGNGQLISPPPDTSISIFHDYKLSIIIFNAEEPNDYDTAKNAVIKFVKYQNNQPILLFTDSTFCNNTTVKFEDFNNDGVKDVLIFYDYDVRSNEMYHLYLVSPVNKRLIRVKDFEYVKNAKFNREKNIIESQVVSGRNYRTYYKINKANKLIDYKKIIYD